MIREVSISIADADLPAEFEVDCMSRADVLTIFEFIRRYRPATFLEVGTFRGATAKLIADKFPSLQITCIDPGDQVPVERRLPVQCEEYLPQRRIGELARGCQNITLIRNCFGNVAWGERRFDMIFIDGDHSTEGCLADSRLALVLLKSPGVILWHDYPNPRVEVVEALAELEQISFIRDHIVHVAGTWLAVYDQHEERR